MRNNGATIRNRQAKNGANKEHTKPSKLALMMKANNSIDQTQNYSPGAANDPHVMKITTILILL